MPASKKLATIRTSFFRRSLTETTPWYCFRIFNAATGIFYRIDQRIHLGSNALLIVFLAISWVRNKYGHNEGISSERISGSKISNEMPQNWILALLLSSLIVTFMSLASGKIFAVWNNVFALRLTGACVLVQWMFGLKLTASWMIGTGRFIAIYLALFYSTMQGQIIFFSMLLFCVFAVELLVRVMCCRLSGFDGVIERAGFERDPLRATVIGGAATVGSCLICMESFADDSLIVEMRCGKMHIFHFDCLAKHLSADKARCPICGQALNLH